MGFPWVLIFVLGPWLWAVNPGQAGRTWVDGQTGHRVVNLSPPGAESTTGFYFHQDPFFSPDTFIYRSSSDFGPVLFRAHLPLGNPVPLTHTNTGYYEVVGVKRQEVFYFSRIEKGRGGIYALSLKDRSHRLVTDRLPFDDLRGVNLTLNATETLLAIGYAERLDEHFDRFTRKERWAALARLGLTNHLLVIPAAGGPIRDIYRTNAWLGHVQFAPCDPDLLEFCREISAENDPVKDRMWVIRADGTGLKRIFPEVPGVDYVTHEFWDPKEPRVWFDLRTPTARSNVYLAGVQVHTGDLIRYPLPQMAWSLHYNISPDGTQFCGDGGGFVMSPVDGIVDADQGKWIWLYRRHGSNLVPERLFDMRRHDYAAKEPNVHFDPTGQWVLFTYNGGGKNEVLAVEVKPSAPASMTGLPPPLAFDAENIAIGMTNWNTKQGSTNTWRLWTDDPAKERWHRGTVLVAPMAHSNRTRTEEGAPAVHLLLTHAPVGKFDISLQCGRSLGVSLDGGASWRQISERSNQVGTFFLKDGRFEIWVDDRYALPDNPGPAYLDCLILKRNMDP